MLAIANAITKQFESGNVGWIAVFFAVAIVVNLGKIYEFIESRKKIQINRLDEAIRSDHVDPTTKDFFKDQIEREYFLYVTGIAAEKPYRNRLVLIHQAADGELPFSHFNRASSHLKFVDNQVLIEISTYEKITFYFNTFVAILFGILGTIFVLAPVIVKEISLGTALLMFGCGAFILVVAVVIFIQTLSVYSAKKIQGVLDKERVISVEEAD